MTLHESFSVDFSFFHSLQQYRRCICAQDVPQNLRWVEAMRPEEAAFLKDLPFTIRVPSHQLLIVHAGLVPDRRKSRQNFVDLFSVLHCYVLTLLLCMSVALSVLQPACKRATLFQRTSSAKVQESISAEVMAKQCMPSSGLNPSWLV